MPFLFGKNRIKIKSKYFKFIFIFVFFFVIFIFSDTNKAHAADRYWVGGTGNWGDMAHWSSTDGGGGGSSVPTSADNVFFSAGSFSANGAVITLNVIASTDNLDFSGLDQTMTLTSTTNALNVYGSLSLSTRLSVSFSSTAYLNLKATTSVNITSNGNTSSWNRVWFDGVGGTWTNQDNWSTTSSGIDHANGTWNTNDKTISTMTYVTRTGVKTLNLGSSTFNTANDWTASFASSGFTLNQGTSTINCGGDFYGQNYTYYNVNLTKATSSNVYQANTFNNLTIVRGESITAAVGFNANQTINGSLTLTGNNSTNYRLMVASTTIGTQRTINVPAANVVASNVDFRDIRFQNAVDLSGIVGLSGDAGGNSGITFTPSASQYFRHTSGAVNWNDTTKWMSTDGTSGPELVTGGNFESGLIGTRTDQSGSVSTWTLNTSNPISGNSDGLLDVTTAVNGRPMQRFNHNQVLANHWIKFSFDYKVNSGSPVLSQVYNGAGTITINKTLSGSGTFVYYVKYLTDRTQLTLYWSGSNPYQLQIDNLSINEVVYLGADRVPLPQDDVYFDANSFTGTSTLTVDVPRIGRSLDMSSVDDAVTMTMSNSIENYGSYVLGNNITTSFGLYSLNLYQRGGNLTLNTFGKILYTINLYCLNAIVTNQSILNITVIDNYVRSTLDFNDFNVNVSAWLNFSRGSSVSSNIYLGNGTFEFTRITGSTNMFSIHVESNLFSENSMLKFNPASGNNDYALAGGGKTYNKVWFSGTHTGNFDITGSNTISEMIIDPGRKVRLTAGTTQQIGKLTAVGTALAPITITSVTSATHTLNYTGASTVASDYLLLSYSTATPANKWYAGINSTNNGNNSGWIFASVPNVPTNLVATSGNAQVSLSWTAPNNNGSSITDYILDFKLSSEPTIWSTFSDGVSSNTNGLINGLTNGLSYDFRISAVNAVGQGSPSSFVSATPATIPDAPIIGTATAGNAQASISFSPPISNGGSAITLYTATSNPGGISNTGLSSPIVVSGLTNGTPYTFTVTATNALGTSPASSASNSVTPATTPDAPTAVESTASNQEISLSWSAPVWNGGSAITDYVVEYKLSSGSDWAIFSDGVSTGTTAVVNGLINGSLYDFRISAVNVMGQGNSSSVISDTPITIPGAPITIVALRGNGEASISFSPPLSDGGSPITNYTVTSQPENHIETGSASPIVVTGLSNGTPYTFTVTATNVAGTGPSSLESNSVTPATIPDAPTSLAGTAGNAQVSLVWSAPIWDGGSPITDYVVEYKLSSEPTTWSIFSDGISNTTSAVVIGLINGSSYDFRVYAANDVGQGSVSLETSAMPITVPDAPVIGIATPGNAQASISFSPPAFDGGSTINSYTVTSSPGNFVSTGNTSPIVVTGLSNGTSYTFTVTATNAVGESLPSDQTDPVTPITVPDAPTEILATPGNAQASISFSPPAFDGGTPILNYTATSSPGNFTGTNNTSPVTVSGLSNGTTYTFTVTATNAVGTGPSSSVSNQVTLSIEPGPPVNLASTVLGSSIGLSWSAPISNGGSAIVDYVIEYKLTTGGVWAIFAEGLNTNTTITVNGLSNGTSYDFRVIAVNIIGEGLPSDIVSAIPGEPAQVLIQGFSDLTVSDIGTNVRITNEGSVEYEYQYVWCITQTVDNLCGGGDDIFSANAAKLIDNGENWDTTLSSTVLIPGDYYFHIGVTYGSKTSTAYQSFTAQATYPLAPLFPSAVAGNGEASISFSPPTFNGGSPVISYQVISNPGGITGNGNSSPIVVTGLSNGTPYTFTVTATNALGTSPASVSSNEVIPMTVPDAPTGISAVAGDSEVTLSWLAPLYDGGSLIIDYIIEYKLSTDLIWSIFSDGISTETTATVTGLTNDLSYDFRVSAVNIIGPSLVDETNITLPADDNNQGGGNNNSGGYNPNFNQTPDAPQPQIELNPITPLVTVEELKEIKTKDNNLPNKKLTKNTITNKETKEPDIKINTNEIRSTPVEKTRILDIFKPKTEPDNNKEESSPLYIIIIIVIALGLIFWLIWFFIRRRKIKNML